MDQIRQQRLRQFGCITARQLPITVPYRLILKGISGPAIMHGFPRNAGFLAGPLGFSPTFHGLSLWISLINISLVLATVL